MAWIYLFIAALFETAWTHCIKYLKFSSLKLLTLSNFYRINTGLPILIPLLGYIVFGLSNIYFFSLALKQLSAATAFTVWTAFTLLLLKCTEIFFFSQSVSWKEVFFMLLIMSGVFGLKYVAAAQA